MKPRSLSTTELEVITGDPCRHWDQEGNPGTKPGHGFLKWTVSSPEVWDTTTVTDKVNQPRK